MRRNIIYIIWINKCKTRISQFYNLNLFSILVFFASANIIFKRERERRERDHDINKYIKEFTIKL